MCLCDLAQLNVEKKIVQNPWLGETDHLFEMFICVFSVLSCKAER